MTRTLARIGSISFVPVRWLGVILRAVLLAPIRCVGVILRSFRFWLLVLLLVLIVLVAYYILADRDTPLTTDAYLQAYVVRAAPQVAGKVVRVAVAEGQSVRRGDALFELDHRPFEHRVAMAEAGLVLARRDVDQLGVRLEAQRADHKRLSAESAYADYVADRDRRIYAKEATSERKFTESAQTSVANRAAVEKSTQLIRDVEVALQARVGTVNAILAKAEVELAMARLDLEYSTVVATCDGRITNLQLREGDFVHVGESALSVVDSSQWRIVANYRERSLERMRPGQAALITFRGAPGLIHRGHVDQIGVGVLQGQGLPSGNLPEVEQLRNWVPPSQRFQVRLALDEPCATSLRVGMTCTVTTVIEPDTPIAPITRFVHRLVALWYYF